jgi:hypothetical protein
LRLLSTGDYFYHSFLDYVETPSPEVSFSWLQDSSLEQINKSLSLIPEPTEFIFLLTLSDVNSFVLLSSKIHFS